MGSLQSGKCIWGSVFLTLIDDFSRNTWTQLLQTKTQAESAIVNFYQMVETQFNCKIAMFRTDNGTEFVNASLLTFFASKGILHQRSIVGTPQQNGVAERKHRHLLETAKH